MRRRISEELIWWCLPVDKVTLVICFFAGICLIASILAMLIFKGRRSGWLVMGCSLSLMIVGFSAFYHNLMYMITIFLIPIDYGGVAMLLHKKAVENLIATPLVTFIVALPLLWVAVCKIMQRPSDVTADVAPAV